jgi:GNAT superfamily N-acetyltransferase
MNIATHDLRSARRTSTPHIEVRLGQVTDVPRIADFLEMFFHLTPWSRVVRFKKDGALAYLTMAIGNGYAPHACAFDAEELVGICSYHVYSAYTDPIAVMDETYVLPRLKRTDLGRRLVSLAIDLARGDGCKVMNFPIASGLPAQNSLMNMVGRHFGAEPVGMIFRKVL